MSNSTLSLCITMYDLDKDLLPRVLESVSKQTVAPDEIVIVSSGLPSGHLPHTKYPYLVVAGKNIPLHTVNSTQRVDSASARNIGLAAAHKDIVQFFDVDDYMHPHFLNIVKGIFSQTACDFVLPTYILGDVQYLRLPDSEKDRRMKEVASLENNFSHLFDYKNIVDLTWSDEHDHVRGDFPETTPHASANHPLACGPLAVRTHLLREIRYLRWCSEDREMVRHLLCKDHRKGKSYNFPLMTYYPAGFSGRKHGLGTPSIWGNTLPSFATS